MEISTENVKCLYETVTVDSALNVFNGSSHVESFSGKVVKAILMYDRMVALRNSEIAFLTLLFTKKISIEEFNSQMGSVLDGYLLDFYLSTVNEIYNSTKDGRLVSCVHMMVVLNHLILFFVFIFHSDN